MANTKYSDKWIRGKLLRKSGQGLTYLSKAILDNGNKYTLKFRRDNKNQERRERMFVEVRALQVLVYPNIPAFIDSNAVNFKIKTEDLYLVTEYIPGQTLQEIIGNIGILNIIPHYK